MVVKFGTTVIMHWEAPGLKDEQKHCCVLCVTARKYAATKA